MHHRITLILIFLWRVFLFFYALPVAILAIISFLRLAIFGGLDLQEFGYEATNLTFGRVNAFYTALWRWLLILKDRITDLILSLVQ